MGKWLENIWCRSQEQGEIRIILSNLFFSDPFQHGFPVSANEDSLLLLLQGDHLSPGKLYNLFLSRKSDQRAFLSFMVFQAPLEKGKATHSSSLTCRIAWTVQSMGSQRVRHDWATFTFTVFFTPNNHYSKSDLFGNGKSWAPSYSRRFLGHLACLLRTLSYPSYSTSQTAYLLFPSPLTWETLATGQHSAQESAPIGQLLPLPAGQSDRPLSHNVPQCCLHDLSQGILIASFFVCANVRPS